jgi:foldase protein PrsA
MENHKEYRSWKRLFTVVCAAVLSFGLLAGCGDDSTKGNAPIEEAQPGKDDPLKQFPGVEKLPYEAKGTDVFVEYKGGKVTADEFERFLRAITFFQPQQGAAIQQADEAAIKNYLREYAATKLLYDRLDEKGKAEAAQEAEKAFESVKKQYLPLLNDDEKKFEQLLKQQKLTRQDIVSTMTLINGSIVYVRKQVTEDDIKKRYAAEKDQFTLASVRHILVKFEGRKEEEALKIANELIGRLKKGEDFAKLASEKSEDPGSKDNGGLYADADVSQWVPEFRDAALTLPLNEISQPVKTEYGYHIMRVEKREINHEKAKQAVMQEKYDQFGKNELDKLITKWNLPKVKTQS